LNSGEARLWYTATSEPVSAPLRHAAEVRAVAFAPDGKTLATGSKDGVARLWEVATGNQLGVPMQHQGPVRVVAFNPNGKTVVTASDDGTARLWEATTGKPIGMPLQHRSPVQVVVFSPDGKTLLTCSGTTARLWDAANGKPLAIAALEHQGTVLCAAFRPDGKILATGPTLRGLLGTAPYMRDGSESTLESVINFYNKGGNANEFLDAKMRDLDREKAFEVSRIGKTSFDGPAPKLFGKDQRPIIPRRLGLTASEKQDLVLFLKALQGDPVDAIVSDAEKLIQSAAKR
jgi:hypothetical protein